MCSSDLPNMDANSPWSVLLENMRRRSQSRVPAENPVREQPSRKRGGYNEGYFVQKVPEKYICSTICSKVLRNPHLTACCGQHFCHTCLQQWFRAKGRRVCPHCREEDFTHILDKPVQREINQLEIHCTSREKGCKWVGPLESFEAHLTDSTSRGCGYVEVDCSNKCGEKPQRRELAFHLINCPLRQYTCQYCNHRDTFRNITSKHYSRCENFPLACTNRCGATRIKRNLMAQHQRTCPLEPVECPFKEAGCEVQLVRKDLDEHVERSTQQHLLLVMSAYREVKKSNRRLKDDIVALNGEFESVKRRCRRDDEDLDL